MIEFPIENNGGGNYTVVRCLGILKQLSFSG